MPQSVASAASVFAVLPEALSTGPAALAKRVAVQGAKGLAGAIGFDLVRRNFYSPVPNLDELAPETWEEPHPHPALDLDASRQLEWLETVLVPLAQPFRPPHRPTGREGEFYLRNRFYASVDAEVLYAMVRHARPRRILELGSGFSTLVTAQACAENAREGDPVDFATYDPYPPSFVARGVRGTRVAARKATDVPLSEFLALEANDILFVDTTHTVKVGSDVNFIVLEVLPRLRPGVFVHFHDIFLPWEYPRAWIERDGNYWAEQYLLHAFLVLNDEFEILFAAHAVARAHPERLARALPSFEPGMGPSAFWIRRRLRA